MEEFKKAKLAGCSVFIELDANGKLGPETIKGDLCEKSDNGELLLNVRNIVCPILKITKRKLFSSCV